ncbi:MAG TPA: hypothetical protein VMX35_07560, partial [Acidobacteriota bacterium]|nr:hypothetical protein [Acidobacteriota bacterium]
MAELALSFAPWALNAAGKVLLILTLALLALWILRRASAALRHILLVTIVAILLLLPLASLLIPQWHTGIIPLPALPESSAQRSDQPLEFTESSDGRIFSARTTFERDAGEGTAGTTGE